MFTCFSVHKTNYFAAAPVFSLCLKLSVLVPVSLIDIQQQHMVRITEQKGISCSNKAGRSYVPFHKKHNEKTVTDIQPTTLVIQLAS